MDQKPHFQAGSRQVSARALNTMSEGIPRTLFGGKGIRVQKFGDRYTISIDQKAATPQTGTKIKPYLIVEEMGDYLVCMIPGDTTEEPSYTAVAKPRLLQQTPFDGQIVDYGRVSIKYTYDSEVVGMREAEVMTIDPADDDPSGTDVGIKESQIIVTPYFPGDIVLACQTETGLTDIENKAITWMDMNSGARCWTHNSRHDPEVANET